MTLLAVVAIAGIAAPLLAEDGASLSQCDARPAPVAIDVKLAPRLAQFRVVLRMIAGALQQRGVNAHRLAVFFRGPCAFVSRRVELLVVSCVVELAMTLPMAIYFHRITIFALPVNIFILPLLAVLMPAALLTLVLLVAWPAAAVVPAMVVALLLHFGVGLVRLFGSLALGDFRIPAPLLWQSAAFCVLLAAGHRCWRAAGRWQRRAAWACAGCWPHGLLWRRVPSSIRAMRCWSRPSTWARAIRCC